MKTDNASAPAKKNRNVRLKKIELVPKGIAPIFLSVLIFYLTEIKEEEGECEAIEYRRWAREGSNVSPSLL